MGALITLFFFLGGVRLRIVEMVRYRILHIPQTQNAHTFVLVFKGRPEFGEKDGVFLRTLDFDGNERE